MEQKLLGRYCKKVFFLKSIFFCSEKFKFQNDPFSNLKGYPQRPFPNYGACHKWRIFGYFSTKLGPSVGGHEQIIT
jgi:hypothetical protein